MSAAGHKMISNQEAKNWFQENVSRETFQALEVYERELVKWQKTINLVANSTLNEIWSRHFLDSWQLVDIMSNVSRETFLVDLGSGAGFPGMFLALAGFKKTSLVESDQRKCAFLRNVSRETFDIMHSVKPTIYNERIENLDIKADTITCRAFAEIGKILEISKNISHENTEYYLLKPLDMAKELTEATKYWYFNQEIIPSRTDPRGCILKISGVKPK